MGSCGDVIVGISGKGGPIPQVPKSANEILATVHLSQRQEQRLISGAELDAAIKYGERTEGDINRGKRAWKFNYGGITFVTDHDMKIGITSWVNPCWGFDLQKVPITPDMEHAHKEALANANDYGSWNSHSVIIVDQSGSMRKTDATKGVTRSDLVWLCLAVDYVGKRICSGEATSKDYLSLIELGGCDDYILKHQPVDWFLYNRIIDFLRSRHPVGHGRYLPAINKAQELLSANSSGKCALQLLFLTDGVPSDKTDEDRCKYVVCNRIASLACRFGSRLTVGGFAVGVGKYSTLEAMIQTAEEYNCKGFLMEASLRVEDLSSAFRSMSTLITETKTTMTDVKTNKQRTYRDLVREPKSAVGVYIESEDEWKTYLNKQHEKPCVVRSFFDKYEYRWKNLKETFQSHRAIGIAVRDHIFGEGRERAVRRVREINHAGEFVGPPLVGKETLFQEDLDPRDVKAFHKSFCKTQQLAQRFAVTFNRKLLSLPGINRLALPTIQFLECWVMMCTKESDEEIGILVEKMLDHTRYKKWNTNNGYVRSETSESDCCFQFKDNEDECSFSIQDIPQAYSHYTYLASGRKFLICDLQGVLESKKSPPTFELTDPAIHYQERTDRVDFGRTDRSEDGIQDFLRTHKCSNLCRMICRHWIEEPLEKEVMHYKDLLHDSNVIQEETSSSARTKKRVKFDL